MNYILQDYGIYNGDGKNNVDFDKIAVLLYYVNTIKRHK